MRSTWNFDIDRYLNRIVPPPPWRLLPYPVARVFGYRTTKPHDIGNLMPIFWAFIGIFCAISVIQVVSTHVPSFEDRAVPLIVGSFGAAAVLEFYAIESPLAQPRNAIVGQLISAIVGVGVCKLFLLSDDFDSIRWVGGAIACAAATAIMALTKTVHPPAGATALLAVADDQLVHLGWFLIPVVLLGCGLMLGVALLVNNIERTFPVYWWTPEDLSSYRDRPMFQRRRMVKKRKDGKMEAAAVSEESEDVEAAAAASSRTETKLVEVVIRRGQVVVPEDMYLTQEEEQLLETLSERL